MLISQATALPTASCLLGVLLSVSHWQALVEKQMDGTGLMRVGQCSGLPEVTERNPDQGPEGGRRAGPGPGHGRHGLLHGPPSRLQLLCLLNAVTMAALEVQWTWGLRLRPQPLLPTRGLSMRQRLLEQPDPSVATANPCGGAWLRPPAPTILPDSASPVLRCLSASESPAMLFLLRGMLFL